MYCILEIIISGRTLYFLLNVYVVNCRDDEFDVDLEDIMVMEAIWLSIQVKNIV
jgi:hypothetical protein